MFNNGDDSNDCDDGYTTMDSTPEQDETLDGTDSDLSYSKVALCVVLFTIALGPPLVYYFTFFYTSRSVSFLRVTSLFYWLLFWLFVPFTAGCSATHCNQQSKTLYVIYLLTLIFIPLFWLIILVESWISRERELICKLKNTKSVISYIQDLKNTSPKVSWEIQSYHYETKTQRLPCIDSNGETFYREENIKEKIITHTEYQVPQIFRIFFTSVY